MKMQSNLKMTRRSALTLLTAVPAVLGADRIVQGRMRASQPWTDFPTRTLDQLPGFRPGGSTKRTHFNGRADRKLAGPGYFRVKQDRGRWWLVDPEGCACIQPAIAAVRPGESERSQKALLEKFGSKSKWAEATHALFRENGFAASGAWSENALLNAAPNRLPWYSTLSFMGNFGKSRKLTVRQPGHVGFVNDCMPLFHPEFESFCDEYARPLAESRDDRFLVGHFSDNELPNPTNSLNRFLDLDPTNEALRVNRDAAQAWLKQRKGAAATAAEITKADSESFREYLYDRYLKITTAAIRKYDPNHLCLGPRLWGPSIHNPGVLRACGRHLDVIGVNIYEQWQPESAMLAMWRKESGKPHLVCEFYAKGEDSGLANTTGAGWLVRTQQDRGDFYQNFTLGLLESRDCVGWQWLTYIDNDPQNKKAELSNLDSNKGIVNVFFEPYRPLTNRMKALNDQVYAIADYFDGPKGSRS
jgi:hypothetical protein